MALNRYFFKITTDTPIHIGSGEVFEPTNFVIDSKNNRLYEFDESLFYQSLDSIDKDKFRNLLNNNSWISIVKFYKDRVENAKKVSVADISVSDKVSSKYKKLGEKNKDGSLNEAKFEIFKTIKNTNTNMPIIPGSSIKGMLETILKIYCNPEKSNNEKRQKLIVSDAILIDGKTEIGYSYRVHRQKNDGNQKIPQMVEVISYNSTFLFEMKSEYSFETIKQYIREYHQARRTNGYFSKHKEEKNSFIVRIGKYSNKEYMVDDCSNLTNSYGNTLATHSLYFSDDVENEQFGWIKLERIDEQIYKKYLIDVENFEKLYFQEKESRQKEIFDKIEKDRLEKINIEQEKIRKEELEKIEQEKIKKEKEEKLNSMSPLEKEIIEIQERDKSNTPLTTLLFNAIKNDLLKSDKKEALNYLIDKMKENNIWKETSKAKNPDKDKDYKNTMEVKKILEKYK